MQKKNRLPKTKYMALGRSRKNESMFDSCSTNSV